MSINGRIALGFFGAIVFLGGIAANNYFNMRHNEGLFNRYQEASEQFSFLPAQEIDHLKWVAKVNDLFLMDDVTKQTVETDDHKCSRGKWLCGGGADTLAKSEPASADLIRLLKKPQSRLHDSAITIKSTYRPFDSSLQAATSLPVAFPSKGNLQ
ncbi:MAG: CZB domain-containing protein [Deltaproteobacteria bacterium]